MNPDLTDRFLDRAEQALRFSNGNRCQSETSFLEQLMSELGIHTPGFSPGKLFRSVLCNCFSTHTAHQVLAVLARPSERPKDALRAGDWMLRFVPGTEDIGHLSVLAFGDLQSRVMLVSRGIAIESMQSGYYGLVIEAGAFPHNRKEPFARRFLDSRGRVPTHTLILRPQFGQSNFFDEVTAPLRPIREPIVSPKAAREPYLDLDMAETTIANEGEQVPDRVIHVYLDDLAHPIGSTDAIFRKVVEAYAKIGINVTVELGSFT